MTLTDIIASGRLNNSLIFGYYGGGNFGDELLLEVLLELFEQGEVQDVSFMYSDPQRYKRMHRARSYTPIFGYKRVLGQLLRRRNIIVGGGGHWGLDMNPRIFVMTLGFFLLHFLLRKKVYLLGVGYYNSTNRLGHLSAWLVAKSSEVILARDEESHRNFKRLSRRTHKDRDIVFNLGEIDLAAYEPEAQDMVATLPIDGATTLIGLRRFQAKYANGYRGLVERLIESSPHRRFALMIFEPRQVDPEGYAYIQDLARRYANVVAADFGRNPLAFVAYLKLHNHQLRVIAPQYHVQLVAHLLGIKHFPLVYDRKVEELLRDFGTPQTWPIKTLSLEPMQEFTQ